MPDVQPTNNPVPSDNPADARDNFKRIDEVVNSTENLTSPTRTGVQLVTLHRYNELVQPNIDGAEAAAASAAASAAAAEAAVSGLDYQGLWPDSGGSANKGDTYQTQVSGTATGQYFTALQNTTVDPVGDNVNWREVVSVDSLSQYTDLVYKDSGGNSAVENMIASAPVGAICQANATVYKRDSISSGDISDFTNQTNNEAKNVEQDGSIENLYSKVQQPVCPPATDTTKLIMRPSGESGFYVVTKRSRNRGGYVMTLVRDFVSSTDASNTGGSSNNRASVVNNCPYVYVANSLASSTSGDVTIPTLSSTFINSVWRYREDGTNFDYFSESEDTSTNNLQNRNLYNVNSGTGNDYVEFRVRGDCTVHLGSSSGSSESVDIQLVDDDGSTLFTVYYGLNLRQSGTLPSIGVIKPIKTPIADRAGFYRVRVINRSTALNEACYVAGLNISLLEEIKSDTYVTNALARRSTSAPKYRSSSGANEFAARENGGKFFGTFHGGHTNIFERLRVSGGANYDIQAGSVPSLAVTDHVTLYSSSFLTPDSGVCVYDYLLTTRFSDGLDISTHSINLRSGTAPVCSDVYIHMCATDNGFTRVYQPVLINSLTDTNTPVGDVQTIEQYNDQGLTIAGYFSGVDVRSNNFGGAYIQDTSNFNKQYYGPVVGIPSQFLGGTFTTIKEYY